MKKLVALLLCLLLLAQFVPASAEVVQETIESDKNEVTTFVSKSGTFFSVEVQGIKDMTVQNIGGFCIGGGFSHAEMTIKAASGYVIDEVEFTLSAKSDDRYGIHSNKGEPLDFNNISTGDTIRITNINDTEVVIDGNNSGYYCFAKTLAVTVKGHALEVPATGDATPIALLGCALVVSAFALAEIRRRRVHA